MLTVAEAYQAVLASVRILGTETVPVQHAVGRVLREPVFADRDYPPINRATMDGIALSSASWAAGIRTWKIEGTVAAGAESRPLADPAAGCVRIMTGADLPANCDGIIPVEDIAVEGEQAAASEAAQFEPGQFVHARSSDRRAGDLLLPDETLLTPPRIAVMAAVGHVKARVSVWPRVAVVSTGSEIVPIDRKEAAPTQVRASNLTGLESALKSLGMTTVAAEHIADDFDVTVDRISTLVEAHDVLLLSGGVSKGDFDYVPEALKKAGVLKIFHRVTQRPGKPLWFGQNGRCTVFGLPGNPVSSLTVCRRYVVPFIEASLAMQPRPPRPVAIKGAITPHDTLTLLYPVKLSEQRDSVAPVEYHGSGDFAALSDSDGFVEVPPGGGKERLDFWQW